MKSPSPVKLNVAGGRRNVAFDAFICVDARSLEVAQFCRLMRRQLDADEPVSVGLFVTH
jgi:hypothetical protein